MSSYPHPRCPHCGWPLDQPGPQVVSRHRTSNGRISYLRCVCGAWQVFEDVDPRLRTVDPEPSRSSS